MNRAHHVEGQYKKNLNRLKSHLNIMEREISDFSETWKSDTASQRIEDLYSLVAGMKRIVEDLLHPAKAKEA